MTKKQKRSLIEIILTVIILLITQLAFINLEGEVIYWIKFSLYMIAYLIIGGRILIKSVKNILKGKVFDEFFLMSLATIVALIMQEFFEGVAVMLFYQVGELFQSIAVEKSRKSITSLMEIAPSYANRIKEDGSIETIDPDEVILNDVLMIKVGEKIPVDGIVIEGESTLDTSSLTGESLPLEIKQDDKILSGSINLSGVIKMKATSIYEDSTVSKILTLIEDASSSKGKTEQFITRFARIYTPSVVALALLLAFIPPLFNNFDFVTWIQRALSFLVISCPCALVISIPLSFFSGIGKASKKGILIKGGVHLEDLSKVQTMFFDKTGTLTTGKFHVSEVKSLKDEDEFKALLKTIESSSSHPLAEAIVNSFKDSNMLEISDIEELSGHGMKAIYQGLALYVGNDRLLKEQNIEVPTIVGTCIHVSLGNDYLGYVVLEDTLKEDTLEAMNKLKEVGIKNLFMITGDKEAPALKVANTLKLTGYYANLLPEDKLEIVKKAKTEYDGKIAYAGDGINDAPTLALCDVSFAMGGVGSTLAMEASDIVLMDDSLLNVALAKKIATKTMWIAKENIVLALGVKLACMILGALGIGGMLLAIFADVGVMIICVLNSMRNYYSK